MNNICKKIFIFGCYIFIILLVYFFLKLDIIQILIPSIIGFGISISLIINLNNKFLKDQVNSVIFGLIIFFSFIICLVIPVHEEVKEINNYEITKTKYHTIIETENKSKMFNEAYIYNIHNKKIKPIITTRYSSFNISIDSYLGYEIKD